MWVRKRNSPRALAVKTSHRGMAPRSVRLAPSLLSGVQTGWGHTALRLGRVSSHLWRIVQINWGLSGMCELKARVNLGGKAVRSS